MSLALLIPGLTITAAMGTASAFTSLANGMYTLSDRVIRSTDSGVTKIKGLIQSSDLKTQIEIMKVTVEGLNINEETPLAIQKAVTSIKTAVDAVIEELEDIDYRIKYNENISFSAMGMRNYKFGNSYKRLDAKIQTLNTRYNRLLTLISMRGMFAKPVQKDPISEIERIEEDVRAIMVYQGDEFHERSVQMEVVKASKTNKNK